MKKIKKTVLTIFVLLMTGFISMAQNAKIPVTSSSEKAVQLYRQFWMTLGMAENEQRVQLIDDAFKEDPDFFMGHFVLAINYLFSKNQEVFYAHAKKALSVKASLSKEENLLRTALKRLYKNPGADVTDIGKTLVKNYPKDDVAYLMMATFQKIIKDLNGYTETLNALLEITDNPAPVYNSFGYLYMNLNERRNAEKAFNKFIELAPNQPNPYDSKGDYFMALNDYENAYKSYMKAYELNNNWNTEKALKAKKLMEQEMALVKGKTPDIKGTWDLIFTETVSNGKEIRRYPGNMTLSDMKIWTDHHFTAVGWFNVNKKMLINYVGGIYSLHGNRYQEYIDYHANPASVGSLIRMQLEMHGDTLIQTWPVDAEGHVDKKNYSVEKYVRLD